MFDEADVGAVEAGGVRKVLLSDFPTVAGGTDLFADEGELLI